MPQNGTQLSGNQKDSVGSSHIGVMRIRLNGKDDRGGVMIDEASLCRWEKNLPSASGKQNGKTEDKKIRNCISAKESRMHLSINAEF